jgi:hypothetical protein
MHLPEVDAFFTPYYCDRVLEIIRKSGILDSTILGDKLKDRCLAYLRTYDLDIDDRGTRGPYDLVVICSDLIVPRNIRNIPCILVQEGMTDPENLIYHIVRRLRFLPLWLASTSTTGLSGLYDRFCVASEGYRDLFVHKGADPAKIVVTGMPNFDNCAGYLKNEFPLRHFVLVCTSDMRETFKFENRKKFIRKAVRLGRAGYLINGPELHRWHHAREIAEGGINFGTKLAVWDYLFGTVVRPPRKPSGYGLTSYFPEGYFSQTLFAFRAFAPAPAEESPGTERTSGA